MVLYSSMLSFRPFPETFNLSNLATITSRACSLKVNPHIQLVAETMRQWFLGYASYLQCTLCLYISTDFANKIRFEVYNSFRDKEYVERGRFDTFAALSFPDTDPQHLETCLAFFYWAFSVRLIHISLWLRY